MTFAPRTRQEEQLAQLAAQLSDDDSDYRENVSYQYKYREAARHTDDEKYRRNKVKFAGMTGLDILQIPIDDDEDEGPYISLNDGISGYSKRNDAQYQQGQLENLGQCGNIKQSLHASLEPISTWKAIDEGRYDLMKQDPPACRAIDDDRAKVIEKIMRQIFNGKLSKVKGKVAAKRTRNVVLGKTSSTQSKKPASSRCKRTSSSEPSSQRSMSSTLASAGTIVTAEDRIAELVSSATREASGNATSATQRQTRGSRKRKLSETAPGSQTMPAVKKFKTIQSTRRSTKAPLEAVPPAKDIGSAHCAEAPVLDSREILESSTPRVTTSNPPRRSARSILQPSIELANSLKYSSRSVSSFENMDCAPLRDAKSNQQAATSSSGSDQTTESDVPNLEHSTTSSSVTSLTKSESVHRLPPAETINSSPSQQETIAAQDEATGTGTASEVHASDSTRPLQKRKQLAHFVPPIFNEGHQNSSGVSFDPGTISSLEDTEFEATTSIIDDIHNLAFQIQLRSLGRQARRIAPHTFQPHAAAVTSQSRLTPRNSLLTDSQEEAFHSRPAVRIHTPDTIKAILVDDWECITKNGQLVKLPTKKSVNVLLDEYHEEEKPKRRAGSADADLLEEVISGLKEYFDKCLGRILLYKYERQQYLEARKLWVGTTDPEWEGKGVGDVYGAEHLARLIVSMPELVAQTNMDHQAISRLREEMTKLNAWLGKNAAKYFVGEYEQPSQDYIDKARNMGN